MSKTLGVIAEDQSDIDVLIEIFSKYATRSSFSVKKFVGNGCGKLRNKCGTWAAQLVGSGCDHIFVFHDLDRNEENALRVLLQGKLPASAVQKSLVVIPIEELEAWLLSDGPAIQSVFSLPKTPKAISDCEKITSPKEHLSKTVWTIGKKRYLNTIHNQRIAKSMSLLNLRRCHSFLPFDDYVRSKVFKTPSVARKAAKKTR